MITALSPCVLPVLPLLLAGSAASESRWRRFAVMAGLVASFTAFTLAGAALLSARGLPEDLLRTLAIAMLFVLTASLLSVRLARVLERPLLSSSLTIVGVHSPEFAFERAVDNVRSAVRRLGIRYPVALDNDFATWRAYSNRWPAKYLIDRAAHHPRVGASAPVHDRAIRGVQSGAARAPLLPGRRRYAFTFG